MKRHIGVFLIIFSLINFLVLFSGVLLSEVTFRTEKFVPERSGTTIIIPSLKIADKIIENVNPWDKATYSAALDEGVAHARGTSLPGESGTSFLFAHSSANPWELLHTNPAFYRLHRINTGDDIIIIRGGQEYRYQVIDQKVVAPSDVDYLINSNKDQLILQTCTPLGTAWKRLLVFARPVN